MANVKWKLWEQQSYSIYLFKCSICFGYSIFWIWCYTSKSFLAEKMISFNVKAYIIGIFLFVLFMVCVSALYSILYNGVLWREKHRKPIVLTRRGQLIICTVITFSGTLLYAEWGLRSQFSEVGVSNGEYYYFPIWVRAIVTVAFLWALLFVF